MHVLLQRTDTPDWQQLNREWYGKPFTPPYEFRFHLTENDLVFSARRTSPALLHPKASKGHFQENLWKYDTSEFFIATADGSRYMEFNLAPNGAWWAAAFTDPRKVNPEVPAFPQGVTATGHADETGWVAEARIPLSYLGLMGICPGKAPCRIAATAILNSPEQLFLTTASDTSGSPDFHRPHSWEEARLTD